jgi:hypothetical protein
MHVQEIVSTVYIYTETVIYGIYMRDAHAWAGVGVQRSYAETLIHIQHRDGSAEL